MVPRALLKKTATPKTAPKPQKPIAPTSIPSQSGAISNAKPVEAKLSREAAPQTAPAPPVVFADDLVGLQSLPDLYDPSTPNDYYELVYKPKILQNKATEIEKQVEETKEAANEAPATAEPPRKGMLPAHLFAEKVLYKQGWKGTGFGLGKEGQGMATPLVGVESAAVLSVDGSSKTTGAISRAPVRVSASRVVLLRNMVGRGQVDGTLGAETAAECAVFGNVLQCIIKEEDPQVDCEDSEAVRIFVQFDSVSAAERAKVGLGGRFFAGRLVQASFFPEAAFLERRYWLPVVAPNS